MIIFYVLFILFYGFLIFKKYKDFKTIVEKVLYSMFFILIIFPFFIYYLDRYNIPSKLGYTINTSSELWLEILINWCVVVTTTFINAAFLIHVTNEQIKSSFDDNKNLNIENQRLQNLPLLNYKIENQLIEKNILNMHIFCPKVSNVSIDDKYFLGFNISVENIGLNSIRKIYVLINSDQLEKPYFDQFLEDSSLKVGNLKSTDFHGFNVEEGTYEFEINIFYQDIMKNWYSQIINLEIKVENNNSFNSTKIIDYKVNDENQIFYNPIEIYTLKGL